MEDLSKKKIELRKKFLITRKAIPQKRRVEAAQAAFEALKNRGTLLSFSPMGSEIDLSALNHYLQPLGKLFLVPYTLEDLSHVPLHHIDAILVPALAFDGHRYRIGYGKGYYDRFLWNVKVPTLGIGFKEQFFSDSLPIEPWDVPVQELFLF